MKKSTELEKRAAQLPLSEYLRIKIHESGKTNVDLAREIGYTDNRGVPKGNVIAMLKSGLMALPLNMVLPTAKALDIDPAVLLRKKLEESMPGLWEQIQESLGHQLVSPHEAELLRFLQSQTKEIDPAYMGDFAFVDEIKGAVARMLDRQITRHREAIATLNEREGKDDHGKLKKKAA